MGSGGEPVVRVDEVWRRNSDGLMVEVLCILDRDEDDRWDVGWLSLVHDRSGVCVEDYFLRRYTLQERSA